MTTASSGGSTLVYLCSTPRIEDDSRFALRLGAIQFGCLPSERRARLAALSRCLDALDTAPTLPGFGLDLAHFGCRVVYAAVITVNGVRHRRTVTPSYGQAIAYRISDFCQ